jgi:U3 small nucleolar RNA-associated protein 14
MSLKHKSTGKWAKRMMSRGADEDVSLTRFLLSTVLNSSNPDNHFHLFFSFQVRQALTEQLNKNQELTRKIAGLDSDEDEDDYNIEQASGAESEEVDEDSAVRRAALAALGVVEDEMERDENENKPTKGVFAMKFMQKGLEDQRREVKRKLERAKQGLEDGEEFSDIGSSDEDGENKPKKKSAQSTTTGVLGRRVFSKAEDEDSEVDEKVPRSGKSFAPMVHSLRVSGPVTIDLKKESEKKTIAKVGLKPLFETQDFDGKSQMRDNGCLECSN